MPLTNAIVAEGNSAMTADTHCKHDSNRAWLSTFDGTVGAKKAKGSQVRDSLADPCHCGRMARAFTSARPPVAGVFSWLV